MLCIYRTLDLLETLLQQNVPKHEYLEDFEIDKPNIVYARAKFCQLCQRLIHENELTIEDLRTSPVTFFETLVMR